MWLSKECVELSLLAAQVSSFASKIAIYTIYSDLSRDVRIGVVLVEFGKQLVRIQ